MTRFASVVAIIAFVALPPTLIAQSGNDLFQKALSKERVDGQLAEAITLYERIVKDFASDRALAARALVQIGRCYERLGRGEAERAYERVLQEFGDQKVSATEARARLAALRPAPAPLPGIVSRQVWKTNTRLGSYSRVGDVSRDGRSIFFGDPQIGLALHDLSDSGVQDRVVVPVATGNTREGPGTLWSAFAPDGKQVAYAWYNGSRYDLRTIGLEGKGTEALRVLYANEDIDWIAPYDWSPDGKWIAVQIQRRDRTAQIGLVSPSDGSLRVLRSVAWQGSTRLSFSPDSRLLAFDLPSTGGTGPRDVLLLAIDGSRQVPLVIGAFNDRVVGWTPDGKQLLFLSDRSGATALWSLPIQDGKPSGAPALVKPEFGDVLLLGLTRTGALYFVTRIGKSVLSIASIDFESGNPVAAAPVDPVGPGSSPAWSPDGKYLAYMANIGKSSAVGAANGGELVTIAIRTLETGQTRELHPQLSYFSAVRWSPDARSFIGQGVDAKAREGIFRVDGETGRAEAIVSSTPEEAVLLPQWLPDGRRIVYVRTSSNLQGEWAVIERDVESGTEREVLRDRNLGPFAGSPDGRSVAYSTYDRATRQSAVMLLPLEGGTPREILRIDTLPPIRKIEGWTPDGRIVFAKLDSAKRVLEPWVVALDGSPPRKLNLAASADYTQVHPDGRRVVYQVPDQGPWQMWVLENVLSPSPPATKGREVRR